jgi:hypothetical protein
MSDLPDDRPASDDATDADGGTVELALRLAPPAAWQMVFALVKIAVDPRTTKRNLRALHDALASVTAGQDKLAAERTAFDEYERTTRAELTAQAAKLREGQVELANAKDAREDNLAERERRIRALEAAWKFVGEDNVDDVARGFRQAEFSALMKARAAHGIGRDHGLDDIAEQMREKFPPTRTVRHDPQGTKFPSFTSLSRNEPEPEAAAGAQAAGARVRYRRRANQIGT